ncbi:MAG: hypothetical protein ACHQ1H_00865 [Nitrososphaerales archaeon]
MNSNTKKKLFAIEKLSGKTNLRSRGIVKEETKARAKIVTVTIATSPRTDFAKLTANGSPNEKITNRKPVASLGGNGTNS